MKINKIKTQNYENQKPGTSGLRKRVAVFQQLNYLENYIQSIFDCLNDKNSNTLVLGGDGRFFNIEAIQIATKMAIANGFRKIIIGQNGLLSTPAASHIIRHYKAYGGIILSASHNPGGENGDFGIKYNISNGGPAPEKLTNEIYQRTKQISQYLIAEIDNIDLSKIGTSKIANIEIIIINPVTDYAKLMSKLFDFDAISQMFKNGFKISFDAMHAVNGPYAKTIFCDMLGADENSLNNAIPSPNFNGAHPDPNLVHAKTLFDLMMSKNSPDFGAATDGDGDRNLIIGKDIFVTPSDSLAIIAANLHLIKGYKNGIKGIARSMPTSMAADRVAQDLGVPIYETPTGWKFFGNLLDDGRITICGEESAGTGSDHVREKDGLWAVLAWLNIIAVKKQSVKTIVNEHWAKFGRNYYTRHDYEEIELDSALKLMQRLKEKQKTLVGSEVNDMRISIADSFSYLDPVDGSLSENQGLRIIFENGGGVGVESASEQRRLKQTNGGGVGVESKANNGDLNKQTAARITAGVPGKHLQDATAARIILRMSGTGTVGATIRLYIEKYEGVDGNHSMDTQTALKQLIEIAKNLTDIEKITGREKPSVIT